MKKLSFQELLDSTKRIQYTDKDVVNSVKPCEPQEIEFFPVVKNVTKEELEQEYKNRGLVPANPYALALFSRDNEDLFYQKKYIATHWKDSKGKWCYAAFDQWRDVGRVVGVGRSGGDWGDDGWFAGLRKSSLKSSDTLDNVLSDLELRIGGKTYKLTEV